MNFVSRTITGSVLIILGIVLISLAFFSLPLMIAWIYGLPSLIIGLFILFNKKEDKIERIRGER